MTSITYTLLILLSCTPADALLFASWYSTFDPWKPTWMARDDLLCDRRCKDEFGTAIDESDDKKAYDKCCDCYSSTTWERDELLVDLYIEYTTADGESVALPQGEWNNSAMYRIIHTDGVMTSLPGNICNISNLMHIDFSGNKIRSLSGIECAATLDTVILKNNRIDVVTNSSIANLTLLRHIDLSHNLVTKVEPNTISNPSLAVLLIDLSDNNLTELDVTNMMSRNMFCRIDFGRNQISKLTNELDFKIDLSQTYGPGMVDLKDNEFVAYPNFQKLLNLDDLSQIGKLFEFGFDFRGAPILCDCNMENFLSLSKDIIETVWRDYHNITCAGPEKYKGVPVVNVPLPDMVCSLGVENDCPVECSCVDQPYHNTIKIDCVNALMTSLPAKLPESYFSERLALNMTGNIITEISEDVEYLERIDVIDLTGNDLAHISEDVASRMENASRFIIVHNPRLKSLPQLFQYRNACSLALDEMILDCNCNSRWIEQWMDTRGCHSTHIPPTGSTTAHPSTEGGNNNDDAVNNNTNNNISTTDTAPITSVNSNNKTSTIITINSMTTPSTFVTTTPQDTTTNIEPTTTTVTSTFNSPNDNNDNSSRNGTDLTTTTSIASTSPNHANNMNATETTPAANETSTHNSNKTGNNRRSDSENDRTTSNNLYCLVPSHGIMNAIDFKKDMLSCEPDAQAWILIVTYALVSVLSGLILVAIFVYFFRYEILILFVRSVLQKPKENILTTFVTYDAFVSFDEENPDLIKWTEKVLIPNLEKDGYKLFIPYRHLEYGAVRDDATIEAMKKSRNMLLLMSESYLEPTEERPFTENEWKYGWSNFKSNSHTPIIVVNFDHITSDMVDDPRIKAYLRVGKVIDFTNHSRDIIPTVEVALGKPFIAQDRNQPDAIWNAGNDIKTVLDDDNGQPISFTMLPEKCDTVAHERFKPNALDACRDPEKCSINDSGENESVSEDNPPTWNRLTTALDEFQQASVGEIKLRVETPEIRQEETMADTKPPNAKQHGVIDIGNVQQPNIRNQNTIKPENSGSRVWYSASDETDHGRHADQARRLRFSNHLLQNSKDVKPVMYSKTFRRAYKN